MSEETKKILDMVAEGKLTSEDAEKLLLALEESSEVKPLKQYTMLRIRVDTIVSSSSDNAKISVNIPLALAKKAASFLSLVPTETKETLKEKGIDLEDIDILGLIEMFEDGEIAEDLVNVETGEKGTEDYAYVRVYVD